MNESGEPRRAAEIVARGALSGEAIEPYGPIWDCAVVRLGRAAWRSYGLGAFLSLEVPYGGTSNGRLSEDAAEIALKALSGQDDGGTVHFLELGGGSGIFAKLFLDQLRRAAPEVYARTRYLFTDAADAMVAAVREQGVLAGHDERVAFAVLDATSAWRSASALRDQDFPGAGGFQGVFANYLLDSLPFDVLAVSGEKTWRMTARSAVPVALDLKTYGLASTDELRTALASEAPSALEPFVRLGPLLEVQARYEAVVRPSIDYAAALPQIAAEGTVACLHSCGALRCLDEALAVLGPGGVAVVSDYGFDSFPEPGDIVEFQHFGRSTSSSVNFAQIDAWVGSREDVAVFAPSEAEGGVLTRVLARAPSPDLSASVDDLYGATRHRAMRAPVEAAREMLRARAFEAARSLYLKALDLQPRNWSLLEEIAQFLLQASGDFAACLELVDYGLEINPISARLWALRGGALVELGKGSEAEAAFHRAIALNPGEVEARRDLAEQLVGRGLHERALALIAEAMGLDQEGDEHEALTSLQERALTSIIRRKRDELLRDVNRFRGHRDLPSADD